jgi:hypothetical protein
MLVDTFYERDQRLRTLLNSFSTLRRKIMANQPSGSCHYCGTPLDAGQRFCPNCGSTVIVENNQQTKMSQVDESTYVQPGSAFEPNIPPPPYIEPVSYAQQGYQATPGAYPTPPPPYAEPVPVPYAQQAYQSTPDNYQTPQPGYAAPIKDSSRSVMTQIGCGFLIAILVILGLCAGGGYLAFKWASSQQDNSSENYIHSTTSAYSQTQDTMKISKPVIVFLSTPGVNAINTKRPIEDFSDVRWTITNVSSPLSYSSTQASKENICLPVI